MTALLTDNLLLLAGAPNGIKKLRELILELAVRGKLLAQNSDDEPACQLLKRIAKEKAQLEVSGKIRKQKPLSQISEEDRPFELPAGWAWIRLADIAFSQAGFAFKSNGFNQAGLGLPLIRIRDVGQVFSGTYYEGDYRSEFLVERGDYLISMDGEFRVAAWEGEASLLNQRVSRLVFFGKEIACRFIAESLQARLLELQGVKAYTTVDHLSGGQISESVIALPPLAEQHRIVAKVDELMALCDHLEAQHTDAESAHAQLVQALLDSLTQASDATDFSTSWQRLAEHFHTLFTTEPSIDALKQTMLQLAVMGKLVPQAPNDEPANELLKRIAEEKARLVAKGKIKKQKPIAMLSEKEQAFGIPARWSWARLGDLSVLITSGSRGWNEYYSDSGSTFIRSQDIKTDKLKFDNRAFVRLPKSAEGIRTRVELGDLLITITGANVAKAAIVEDSLDDAYVSQHVALIRLANRSFGVFIHKWLTNSHGGRALLLENSYGAKPGLNLNNIRDLPVPVPPISEQHRIVAKIDQLMAICDQLKTRLTQARQLNEQLANTLVERALADDAQQAPVATEQKAARTLLAAEVTHRLHAQRTFGQRKLQKVVYLAEHAARLATIQGSYLRNVAGPHDRQLMNQIEGELQNHQWYERIERETVGHAYRPLSQAGQHRQAYTSAWSATERAAIEQIIELMRDWDTDRCEMTVTLYAVWNDFILEGRPVSDEAIVDEVMHRWNDTKLRFGNSEWLAVLAKMKKQKILIPTGFGKRTTGGMLSLPGFE
ncbi:restriction endonuclease subunit S [Pseudomonas sp. PDM05]|uniref:restriction endonuclease subunit S n=1 Tax=Pseudomonas sp. PDM05 TaxID=2769301 RepID=UPI0017850789|nr:restriction endonuclease subunit S [Pseudomonas sp. PDM05]MBD9458793.1 restriction endonuclease subunit S [Pseudomonas sp. PDM05]